MDKTQQFSSCESPAATQTPINDSNPTGEMPPPFLTPSPNSGVTDELCQATDRLKVVDIQKNNVKSVIGIDQDDYYPSWDSLSGPPLDHLLFQLFNDEDLKDLNNFAMVSPYFRNEAKLFTKGAENRPGIKYVNISGNDEANDVLLVEIELFRSNIPFYDFADLDWNRFERVEQKDEEEDEDVQEEEVGDESKDDSAPVLRVILSGPQDPAIEQLCNLLHTSIQNVDISHASLNYCTVAKQLLRNATIGHLTFWEAFIDDTTAPMMLEIVSRLKSNSNALHVIWPDITGFSDPDSFVTSLCAGVTAVLLIDNYSPFFGLSNSFWEKYLSAKLSSGSVRWIEVNNAGRVTNTPVNIDPNQTLYEVEWGQANDE